MPGIDENLTFRPINIAVMTVSDSRSLGDDKSGTILVQRITDYGHNLVDRAILIDDIAKIKTQLQAWIDDDGVEVVISTGGTGVTGRDVTPEAFAEVYEKEIAGFGEVFRQISYKFIGTSTIQSRATAGVVNGTYLFALPGSPGACRDGWDHILKDQLDVRYRPCNFAELLPRLREHLE